MQGYPVKGDEVWPAVPTPLQELTRAIAGVLRPVQPRPEFRSHLHQGLMTTARQKQAQRVLGLPAQATKPAAVLASGLPGRLTDWFSQEREQHRRYWVLGAAAVGSAVSLAGLLAYLLSRRGRPVATA